jgi:arabinogalactan oligomer/maltooligosaccharide transport system permease protein
MHKIKPWQQVLYQLGLLMVGVYVLVPIWVLAYMAFDGSLKGSPVDLRIWPEQFTLEVFQKVWHSSSQALSFPGLLRNSLIVAGGAALLAVVFGASMAYAFARYRFPGRRVGLFVLLVGAFLPPVALMTPLYLLLEAVHLRTSLLGLMIVYTAIAMPFCIWNMRASFQAVSKELEEAAFLDGAGPLTAFLWVTLPLALPSIAVAALVAFLVGYTEFAIGWLFIESSENVTLAMAVSGVIGQLGGSGASLAALAILMSLPVVIIFLLLQRYLIDRLLIGRVET